MSFSNFFIKDIIKFLCVTRRCYLEAKVREEGEFLVIYLAGKIDLDSVDPFRHTCQKHLIHQKVIFNLNSLSFVGSSGITSFLETLTEYAKTATHGLNLVEVSSEFKKIFEANLDEHYQVFECEQEAFSKFKAIQSQEQSLVASNDFVIEDPENN